MALAEPFFFRVRDAHFVLPLYVNTKHARFASGASLETRASPRPKCQRRDEIWCFPHCTLARRAEREVLCTYHVLAVSSLALFFSPLWLSRLDNTDSTKSGSSRRRLRGKKNVACRNCYTREGAAPGEARGGVARAFPRGDVRWKRVFGAATALLCQNERGRPEKGPFSSSRKAGKAGKSVATKRTFSHAASIRAIRDVCSHVASPGTRLNIGSVLVPLHVSCFSQKPASERFPARSRQCCSCRPEASRSGAEAEKGGLRCFSVRRENANFTKTHLFVANALRSQNRAFQEKRVNVPKKALPL